MMSTRRKGKRHRLLGLVQVLVGYGIVVAGFCKTFSERGLHPVIPHVTRCYDASRYLAPQKIIYKSPFNRSIHRRC
jgi:hypothetical protein